MQGGMHGGFHGSAYGRTVEWIPVEVYIRIPPSENPFELGWKIVQGRTLVASVPFGSYGLTGMFQENIYVRADRGFSLLMDLQFSNYGKGKSKRYQPHQRTAVKVLS